MKSSKWWMSLAGALWLSVGCALGETETVDGIEWWYDDVGILCGPTDKSLAGDVVIPSILGGTPITAIWQGAFGSCTNLTSVTIPDGIMSIGHAAFDNCSSLTSVTIPDSVTDIGGYAFSGCTGLTNVTFGIGVTNIGVEAFSECINLYDTNSLPGVCLVNGWAVGWNDGLSEDVDLTGIRGIAGGAFSECGSLMNVTIPDSATIIGEMSFSGCSSLMTVTIGDGVTDIGRDAFYNCSSLASVAIGDSVTSIGDGAFYNCSSLTSVTIPDSVTSIGDNVFYGCSALYGDWESVPGVWLVDGWVVNDGGPGPCGDLDLTGIRGITDRAFYNCSCLESVTIPEGVTHIGANAFSDCRSLTNVTLPDGLTSIGERAFYYCDSLPSVTLPDSVTSIGEEAFDGCYNLTAVYIHDLAAWCGISFDNGSSNPLYYAHHLYLNGEEVVDLLIPDGVASINAFSGCSGLTSVTIPDSVTSIGHSAFYGCTGLRNITIPDSMTRIGDNAFAGCSSLETLYVPAAWEGTSMLDMADVPSGCKVVYVTSTGVPCSWLEENAADILAANGGDYEAAASAMAPIGRPVWECYLTGAETAAGGTDFEVSLRIDDDGNWIVEWTPDLNDGQSQPVRDYRIEAKRELLDEEWTDVTAEEDLSSSGWNYFRVGVSLP